MQRSTPTPAQSKSPRSWILSWVLFFGFAVLIASWITRSVGGRLTSSQAQVVKTIIDGDRFVLEDDGVERVIKLACLNAPESEQDYGEEATAILSSLLPVGTAVQVVEAHPTLKDQQVALVFRPDGLLVNAEVLRQGGAMQWESYLGHCAVDRYAVQLHQAQREAQETLRGIWGDPKSSLGIFHD